MGSKKYISPAGTDFTEFVRTDEDARLFEEMRECEERTRGVPLKECEEDVVRALQIGRRLRGQEEGLAKLQARSRINLN